MNSEKKATKSPLTIKKRIRRSGYLQRVDSINNNRFGWKCCFGRGYAQKKQIIQGESLPGDKIENRPTGDNDISDYNVNEEGKEVVEEEDEKKDNKWVDFCSCG